MSRFTVTSPAEEVSLLNIAELREAAGVSDASQDARLLGLGRGASTALARQCCIVEDANGVRPPTLLRETCTETFRWVGCGPLRLSRRPVTSIVSVTADGALIDGADYEIAGGRNLWRLSSDSLTSWSSGKITVVYQAGWSPAPYDLKQAASKLVTALNAETARDPSLKRESVPGVLDREYWVAPSNDPYLSREISDLIAPYVEIWV